MKNWSVLLCFTMLVLLSSCAGTRKVAFTQEVRNKLEAQNIDLSKLQYYVDGDVVLAREVSSENAKVEKGEVVLHNGKYYETITLKPNTPGVCTAVYPNRLNISFDENGNSFLPFVQAANNTYQIINNDIYNTNASLVWYNGIQYVLNYFGNPPTLLVKKSTIRKTNTESKIMPGRKLN